MDFERMLSETRVIPVVEIPRVEDAVPLARTLAEGGLACAEITFRTAAAGAAIAAISEALPGFMVGAGTVLSVRQAEEAVAAGARFLVSPGFDDAVVGFARDPGVPVLPGVCTPSEIMRALAQGVDIVKFFPAEAAGGLDYLKAVAAPFGAVRFVPTGGIGPANVDVVSPASAGRRLRRELDGEAAGDRRRRLRDHRPADRRGRRARRGGRRMKEAPMPLVASRPAEDCRWDLVALGEVMLRLDPGEGRIATARSLRVCEGGGEYNVARGLRRCFGLRTAVVTALADNPVGRLVEDLMLQGGVDQSHVSWVPYDGVGREVRNGLNFTERGFGVRGAVGCSDRGNTAVSQLRPGDIDWDEIFAREGARWFHCGGIFAALSESTADVAAEAMASARRHGTIVSYDLNYRPSLWKSIGGQERAREVNRALAPLVDVMLGNEEDFSAALGFPVEGVDEDLSDLDPRRFGQMMARCLRLVSEPRRAWPRPFGPSAAPPATTGARSAGRTDASTSPWRGPAWRSSTAWAAEIRSPRGYLRAAVGFRRSEGARVRGGARRARHDHAG